MRTALALVGSMVTAAMIVPSVAWPCGGMVFPRHAERPGGMSDQELLLAFTETETVLVASAGYEGSDADDFAFLLPLASAPAEVLDADPALFIALDEQAAPQVSIFFQEDEPPQLGCGARAGDGAPGDPGDGSNVMVEQRGTTSTYEWVVVGGDTGTAIATWLEDEGYALPPDYAAALDPYVSEGWSFFAAKVRAEVGEGALAPIELHLPASPVEAFRVPLGIAAHSLAPGQPLGITTYVWSDGAVVPDNYATDRVSHERVEALSDTESNYEELQREILDDPEGAWIIDFARETTASEIRSAYVRGEDEGRVDASVSDVAFVDEFFGRLGQTEGYLTRIRTELPAEVLRDLELRPIAMSMVDNVYFLTFEEESGGCTVGRGGAVPVSMVLLLPALAWARRRRLG